eukprot:TRINITY_DN528_c0_g1_i1.p1 TRINITY_DN528_c0_g1~~TRINITY_DN528_c0_g1_i1.p1  ORF type:complete len:186 (+),score=18.79 TRINITY_DN528_c0_g1_i1:33-560(+)
MMKQFEVIGRKAPTASDPAPKLLKMKLFAEDVVRAKSKYWFFLRQLRKMKSATGQIVAIKEVHESNTRTVKNYGIWLRYTTRSGCVNMFKEVRSTSLNDAVTALYQDMAGRHRARKSCIQIIRTAVLAASECKRPATVCFHNDKLKFPLVHIRPRIAAKRTGFKTEVNRPKTFVQ